MQQTILGLGSNVGNRAAMLEAAALALAQALGPLQVSGMYESAALLPAGAPVEWDMPYLNMAVAVDTTRKPDELLAIAKRIECELGRQERGRWGPREIDIDVLVCGDRVVDMPHLKIPHPELLKRNFALVPMSDIAPEWRFPGGTAYELALPMRGGLKCVRAA